MADDIVASKIEFARLVLQAHGLGYEIEAGDRLAIEYGSARLTVVVRRTGESSTVRISACAVDAVAVTGDDEFRLLRSLNERNRTVPYGKFHFDPAAGEVHVEYEMLGDDLQDSEFMNALTTVARLADEHDDILVVELGHGRRAADRN